MPQSIIPFGPQHPVLPEPIHLKLTFEDEVVTEVQPALGFVHRGLEKMVAIRDFQQIQQVVERVCGICSMIHGMCYAQGMEKLMGVEAPSPSAISEGGLVGAAPHSEPSSLVGSVCRLLGLREPFHGMLEDPGKNIGGEPGHHRQPGDYLGERHRRGPEGP